MQSLAIFFLFFLSGNVLSDERANRYIENFLSTSFASEVRSLHLDPGRAPEFEVEFEELVKVFGKVKGKAEFEEGRLEGLSHAKRQSECHSHSSMNTSVVNCTIGFEELKVRYEGKLKYGRMPKMGVKGKAKIEDTLCYLEIAQSVPTQPLLRNYTCTKNGDMKVKFTGLGPLNRFMNVLEEGYSRHVLELISNIMNQQLQYAMNRALSKDILLL